MLHIFALVPFLTCFTATVVFGGAEPGGRSVVAFSSKPGRVVPAEVMKQVYEEVKTPFKYGIVLYPEPNQLADCPCVFRHDKKWYMTYIAMTGPGYETLLAESNDLLHWKKLGKILEFSKTGWDAWQGAGSVSLQDFTWGGSYELNKFHDKFWMSYIGGAIKGYETPPLAIGIAWTLTPGSARPWQRIAENPGLSTMQADVRKFEQHTLYRSTIIWDRTESLGWKFVMFYNARFDGEQIGMAVSHDMVHWRRYGSESVICNGTEGNRGISGDPQITKIGYLWVMFYFGAGWKPNGFDTFACSYDLVHWTKWEGQFTVEPSEPWDKEYAHKPWIIKHGDVVYHFYCATGNQGRVIALATSKNLVASAMAKKSR